jgi:hypothetical protein
MVRVLFVVLLGMSLSGCFLFEREKDRDGNYIPGSSMIEKAAAMSKYADLATGYPVGSTLTGIVGIVMGLIYKKKAVTNETLAKSTMLGVEGFANGPGAAQADQLKDWIAHDHKVAGVDVLAQTIADTFGHTK